MAVKYAHDSSSLFRDELDIISKLAPHENIVKYYGGRFSGQVSHLVLFCDDGVNNVLNDCRHLENYSTM